MTGVPHLSSLQQPPESAQLATKKRLTPMEVNSKLLHHATARYELTEPISPSYGAGQHDFFRKNVAAVALTKLCPI